MRKQIQVQGCFSTFFTFSSSSLAVWKRNKLLVNVFARSTSRLSISKTNLDIHFTTSCLDIGHITRKMASSTTSKAHLSYSARIPYHTNAAAVKLLELMDRKKTNLCVSVDVTKGKDMLEVVRRVGKSCCMIKASDAPLFPLRIELCPNECNVLECRRILTLLRTLRLNWRTNLYSFPRNLIS
jgi:hypothetical protein